MTSKRLSIAVWLAALIVSGGAAAQTLALTGLNGESRTIKVTDLAAMPRQAVTVRQEGGKAVRYEGVLLTVLLQSVGAPAGKGLHGRELADIVVVSAKDGYRVALALADTDPAMRGEVVLLADRADGAPLGPAEGPLRLVVEGDLRPARSARMVTAIAVERATAP